MGKNEKGATILAAPSKNMKMIYGGFYRTYLMAVTGLDSFLSILLLEERCQPLQSRRASCRGARRTC